MTGAPLQPNLKAASTAQHSQLSAVANSTPTVSRAASPAPHRRPPKQEPPNNDYLSEKSTQSLIRRILVSDSHGSDRATPGPIEGILPPLTSSNEVDVQLYAIISVVIKDFVQPWYTKITPDHAFVEEIVQIIAHCTRAIEQRLRQIDLADLALNEIPAILQQHVQDYRTATSAQALPYGKGTLQVYHALNPHPALDPELSAEDRAAAERIHRQLLIQGALAVLLPTEDLQNSSLRILVTDIIADLILGRAINDRLCHGWFLHDAISKVTAIITHRAHPKVTGEELQADARGRLEKFGLLSNKDQSSTSHSQPQRQSFILSWFWAILQWFYLAVVGIRYVCLGLLQARRQPARTYSKAHAPKSAVPPDDSHPPLVLDYNIFSTISTLLNLSTRMPWLVGALAFSRHVLTAGHTRSSGIGSTLDRFLHTTLTTHLLPIPTLLPLLLRNLRATIFPQNSLGPAAPPPPSPAAALAIRATAARDILSLIPKTVTKILFAPHAETEMETQRRAQGEVEAMLSVFEDERLNKYWIYGVLELLVVRIVPELVGRGPGELLAERGVEVGEGEGGDDVGAGEEKAEGEMGGAVEREKEKDVGVAGRKDEVSLQQRERVSERKVRIGLVNGS